MARRLVRLAVAVILSFCAVQAPARVHAAQSSVRQDPQQITVYVTRTGAKYHRDGCRYLSRSGIPMTLKEAAKRFEPCKICRPPVLPAK